MIAFMNHSLYVNYSSSQYGTKVLQSHSLKSLTSLSGPCHALLQYHMVLLGCSDTICNDPGKALDISVLSLQKTSQLGAP
jgi:hypothetical protein